MKLRYLVFTGNGRVNDIVSDDYINIEPHQECYCAIFNINKAKNEYNNNSIVKSRKVLC